MEDDAGRNTTGELKCNVMEVGVEEGIRNGEEEREDVEGLKGVRTTLTVD